MRCVQWIAVSASFDSSAPSGAHHDHHEGKARREKNEFAIQMPLLVLGGWLVAGHWWARQPSALLERFNRFGLTGFIVTTLIAGYWMIPSTIDRAVVMLGTGTNCMPLRLSRKLMIYDGAAGRFISTVWRPV